MPRTSEGQEPSCSASMRPGERLSTFATSDPPVLSDVDHCEMTGLFQVKAFQIRPKTFDFRA